MLIASRQHTAGNSTRYWVNYIDWLDDGRTLVAAGCSAALAPGSTVTDVTVTISTVTADKLYFFVTGGSLNEAFTVQVTAKDTLGEIVIDTIQFTVVQP
jgi:hypothetical protein